MEYPAIVEVAEGSYNKYGLGLDGNLVLEWVSPVPFAANYGFIEGTLCSDRDPIDVIIASTKALPPRTRLKVRPVSVLYMQDNGENDPKVVAVACDDPKLHTATTVDQISGLSERYIEESITQMKQALGSTAVFNGWGGAEHACKLIEEAMKTYEEYQQ